MSQNIELNKIKIKIKALAAKTVSAGCTEHEAHIAMGMVGKLLSQYNLTMEEIDVREGVCKTIHIVSRHQRRGAIDNTLTSLANLVSAKVWYLKGRRGEPSKYAFFGHENDLELIQYLYAVIDSALVAETEKFKTSDHYKLSGRRHRKTASTSFARGMANQISTRLNDLRKENEAELRRKEQELYEAPEGTPLAEEAVKANKVKGTALIVLKGQLIEEEFKKSGVKLGRAPSSTRSRWDSAAHDSGREAGKRVNLSRPIGNGNRNAGLLK